MNEEEKSYLKALGLTEKDLSSRVGESKPIRRNLALQLGFGTVVILNIGILLSLPPVLRGRGAPFLPTFQKSTNAMFSQLRKETNFMKRCKNGEKLTFVDLGSGDGRIVFRAVRENLFQSCIGYELNPMLHIYACIQRILYGPLAWHGTRFYLRDLWYVNLRSNADVVVVYGLGPMMKDLGVKLENELKPGSIVLSNVFSIPGWVPQSASNGTFLYIAPGSYQSNARHKGQTTNQSVH